MALSRDIQIINKRGLHARASRKFVECAGQFDCEIFVEKEGQQVLATSIMGLLMLGASQGTTIRLLCADEAGTNALDALCVLIGSGFGEEE